MPHTGLPTLDAAGAYQVWSIVDGEPVTGGLFDIAEDGELTTPDGDEAADIWAVGGLSDIVITLEPYPDSDPAPADTHVAAGAINPDGTLEFDIDHPAVFGHRFDEAAGSFLLATPTNGPDSEELSGAWFLTSDEKAPSLTLPELPPGWTYEGWAVIDDTHVSTGRFTAADNNMFSGDEPDPDRTGEDFLPPRWPTPRWSSRSSRFLTTAMPRTR